MAIVTGFVDDFGPAELAASGLTISFTPSGPAVQDAPGGQGERVVLSSRAIDVVPALDGSFRVDLVPTDTVQPNTWYTITMRWLNGADIPIGADFPDWRLYVPTAGGSVGDLLAVPTNPIWVWTSTTPPANPTPGIWWLNPTTGDLNEWSN